MPYKDYQKQKENSIKTYYKNREKIIENLKMKYHNDPNFKRIFNIRRVTAHKFPLSNEKCEVCGSNKNLHRHHIHYSTLRKDIKILCRDHHFIEHKRIKTSRN